MVITIFWFSGFFPSKRGVRGVTPSYEVRGVTPTDTNYWIIESLRPRAANHPARRYMAIWTVRFDILTFKYWNRRQIRYSRADSPDSVAVLDFWYSLADSVFSVRFGILTQWRTACYPAPAISKWTFLIKILPPLFQEFWPNMHSGYFLPRVNLWGWKMHMLSHPRPDGTFMINLHYSRHPLYRQTCCETPNKFSSRKGWP